MGLLDKNTILAADDLARETVTVDEWGGDVLVQGMSAAARDAFEDAIIKMGEDGKPVDDHVNFRAKLAAAVMVNEDGSPMFTPDEVVELAKKSYRALDKVLKVGRRLSGMTLEEQKELEKNSDATQGDDSSSS